MSQTTDSALRKARRLREMKLAQAQILDEMDMQECLNDLQTRLGMDQSTARVVAHALRAKMFPNAARAEGLDDEAISLLMQRTSGIGVPLTADFAKDKTPKKDDLAEDPLAELPDKADETPEHELGESAAEEQAEHDFPTSPEETEEGDLLMDDLAQPIHGADLADGQTSMMKDDTDADEGADTLEELPEFDGEDDFGEANDGLTKIELEVPADQVEEIKQLLEQFFPDSFADETDLDGGDLDLGDEPKEDTPADGLFEGGDAEKDGGEKSDTSDAAEESQDDARPQTSAKSASRKVATMNKETQAGRKAQREAVLAKMAGTRTASEEANKPKDIGLGKDTSANGKPFQHAGEAQYTQEDNYPTMNLEGSEGNSLREQNPSYAKQDIPTKNPQNLGLKSGLNAVTKEGTESGELEYEVAFNMLDNVPSGDPDRGGDFQVPTQMGEMPRKRTAAISSQDDAEEELYQLLVSAGLSDEQIGNMTYAQGLAMARKITASRLETLAKFAGTTPEVQVNVAEEEDEEEERKAEECTMASKMVPDQDEEKGDGPRLNKQPNGDGFSPSGKSEDPDEKAIKEAEVFRARLKTAYAINSKLVLAGALAPNELDAAVDDWMANGMSVKSMLSTGAQLLKLAQSATERVATAQAEKAVRTASMHAGLASVPAFSSPSSNSAPADLQEALKHIDWSAPRFDS